MKKFRFLAIAILMLSVLILPVNASHLIDGNDLQSRYVWSNNPSDTICIISYYDSATPTPDGHTIYRITNNITFKCAPYDSGHNEYIQSFTITAGTYFEQIPAGTLYLNAYKRGTNKYIIYINDIERSSVQYGIDENYHNPLGNAYIDKIKSSETVDSVSYDVQCMPENNMTYSAISFEPLPLTASTILNSESTKQTIVIGDIGVNVYAVARSSITGQKTLIQEYLAGKSEQPTIEPTIEPTAQPTGAPDDDLSQYGEKKNFQIRNIDYSADDMLLIDGINITIYYIDSNDNFVNKPIYKSNSAPSVIDLRVPIAGGLFVEYGITPNYEPVKIQNYPYLNNRSGYWITQELSSYENLYYQYYDSDNPLTDINYGITLIDGNTHLPVSNAAINIDGSNTQYTSNYGGTVFKNITQGLHTFTINKQGYNSLTFTKNIVITSSTEIEFFPISAIPTATITPSPVKPITPSPTISPIDKPSNIIESVSWGLAKVFGVKTVDNANYIFALLIILFPAAIAGGITHQALGFIAGGMLGFVFALTIGLVPIWTFFAMCLLAVIYIMLIRGNEGF